VGFRSGEFRPTGFRDLLGEKIGQALVKIVAAQARVAIGAEHLEDALVQFQDREVERAAAEVVNGDLGAVLQLIEAIGQRGGGGLVDDALDLQSGQFAGADGGVALRVVEVGRHRDDGTGDGFAERGLRVVLQLLQDLRGDLLRRPSTAVQGDRDGAGAFALDRIRHQHFLARDVAAAAAHEAFHGVNGFGWLQHPHPVGPVADDGSGIRSRNMHHRRRQALALGVRDDIRNAAVHDGDERIGGAEINADNLAHERAEGG
jgi:hypothetical protein